MSMPLAVTPQFNVSQGRATNLDRCNKCGAPRSVHGPDWSCPAPPARKAAMVMLYAGALLMAAGLGLRFATRPPLSGTGLLVFFVAFIGGLYLLMAGALASGRGR